MTLYRRNLLVGATVLGGVLIVGWMVLQFSSRTAELFAPPQIPIHFVSARADGLSEGSAVLYLGVDVGRVTALARDTTGVGVQIDAQIDRNPPMPANLRAEINQSSPLGGASVISLDVDGQPPKGSLQPNATIKTEYVGLQMNLLPPALSDTAGQIGAMSEEIRKTAQQLRQSGTITDLDATIKGINVEAAKAGQVLDSFQTLLGDPQTRADLKVAIANIRTTTETTSRIAAKLDALTDSLQHTSDNASASLKDAQQHIDDATRQVVSLLASVQTITDKIGQGKGTAGALVNDPKLYQSLVDSSRELDATIADLKRLIEQWEQEGVSLHLK